jgi:CDP-glucose 4,6-dehydratase
MKTKKEKIIERVLVTGGSGFVGGHLVRRLKENKIEVLVYDRKKGFDIRDYSALEEQVKQFKPDVMVHLVAIATVGEGGRKPRLTFEVNVDGTFNVLEIARQHNINTIIMSTDKVYGYQPDKLPYLESTPLQPIGVYDVTKAMGDLMAQIYAKVYDSPLIILRPCNIYGFDKNMSRLMPEVITKCIKGDEIVLRSDGTQVREYIFIGDMVDAFIKLMNEFELHKGRVFNVGSGQYHTVLEVVEKIKSIMDSDVPVRVLDTAKNEIKEQYLDSYLMKNTGWKPKHLFDEGLKKTIETYKKILERDEK